MLQRFALLTAMLRGEDGQKEKTVSSPPETGPYRELEEYKDPSGLTRHEWYKMMPPDVNIYDPKYEANPHPHMRIYRLRQSLANIDLFHKSSKIRTGKDLYAVIRVYEYRPGEPVGSVMSSVNHLEEVLDMQIPYSPFF